MIAMTTDEKDHATPDQLADVLGPDYGDDGGDWQERALCAQTDPEAFFPEKGGTTSPAKRLCLGCDVRAECLEYALQHDERFGVWGGLSERERRRLKKGAPVLPQQRDGEPVDLGVEPVEPE